MLRWFMRQTGYMIVKRPGSRRPKRMLFGGRRDARIVVAGKELLIPHHNPLYEMYKGDPYNNSRIHRICEAVGVKYNDASFLDIGANIGDTAAVMRQVACGPIVCVEGDPDVLSYLDRNAAAIGDVRVVHNFLGEATATVKMKMNNAGWNASLLPNSENGSDVSFVALSDLVAQTQELSKCRFVKIDAEGYDLRILRGGMSWLAERRPVVMFEYNGECLYNLGESPYQTFDALRKAGYAHALVWDAHQRFVLGVDFNRKDVIDDLLAFADGFRGSVYYYDFCLFAESDRDVYEACCRAERAHRDVQSGPQLPSA